MNSTLSLFLASVLVVMVLSQELTSENNENEVEKRARFAFAKRARFAFAKRFDPYPFGRSFAFAKRSTDDSEASLDADLASEAEPINKRSRSFAFAKRARFAFA